MKKKLTLNEELNRMKRLMDFSIVENSHDVLAEQNTSDNKGVTQTDEKGTEWLLPSDTWVEKYGRTLSDYNKSLLRKIKARDGVELHSGSNPTIELQRKNELDKYSDGIYEKFLYALYNGNRSKNAQFWYKDLTQETRKSFLSQFEDWISSGDKKMGRLLDRGGLKNKNWEITANISKGKKSEVTTKGVVSAEPPVTFDFDMTGKNTFIDNVSDISPDMQAKIDEFIVEITPAIEKLKIQKVDVTCDKLDVASSSSRFRNTVEAKDLTWAQLSEARSSKVYEEIYKRLEELGVIFTNVNKVLRGGTNADGTSGPNPGTNEDDIQYTISKDGTYKNIYNKKDIIKNINKYGEPHVTKAEYDKYKFCIVEVVISALIGDEPEPFTETIVVRGWTIVFSVNYITGQGKSRTLKGFKGIKFKRKKGKRTPNITKCARHSGGVRGGS